MKLAICLLALASTCWSQQAQPIADSASSQSRALMPDAPNPKHEVRNYALAALGFAATSGAMIYAQHDGARQCQAEDNRAGFGKLFGTAPGYGLRPHDWRVYAPGAAIEVTALVLELKHHQKIAKGLLRYGAAAQGATAVATWWAGCN